MKIPSEMDGAKVLLYTKNSISNEYGTVGLLNENNEIFDEIQITAMAICKYEGGNEYYLFSCDLNWEVVGDFDHDTLEEAKESAKFNHNVNYDDWIAL
ncbi:hypothetical protein [Halalkalibacter sp. APA_J-10(15)]|uniref:hypothetical protein n=1 Tax=Halalkalibacter sp. APA_J-10(15) TaxID=2933805 RepID=UPI001FF34DEB|nr:hypothetical protein [Halalkalibacter sp. APA_J-10(15)]MCK0473232.1 hypothetical protein [Halalkalibacter sp. APA_J-10(15)]